jgi:hypothetical protein
LLGVRARAFSSDYLSCECMHECVRVCVWVAPLRAKCAI